MLAAGTYPGGNVVPPAKHDITIRGADRNAVVLDGAGTRKNGILVHADGVSIMNLSAHDFLENAFYWQSAGRFRGSYLTAWNVRGYGIYVEDGSRGVLDHDYVSGATITGSGRARVPIRTALAGFVGVGIAVAGGNGNVIRGNRVLGSERYGIAVFPTARYVTFRRAGPEPGPPWRPRGNRVSGNVASGSGRADLALAKGSGSGNCFVGNIAAATLPRRLGGCAAVGDRGVAAVLAAPVRVMFERTVRRRRPPSYRSMPAPQPNMPG